MIDPVVSNLRTLDLQRLADSVPANPSGPLRVADGAMLPTGLERSSGSTTGFGDLVGGLIGEVNEKSRAADAEVRKLMLGESDNIHRSMIAMQEAGLAFSLLVEVRNKLVESYQELMRMPV